MQVAMAHYRMMEKADRDNSRQRTPKMNSRPSSEISASPLVPKAEQLARRAGSSGRWAIPDRALLLPQPDYRAAAARLLEITERYPLYSQGDEALWMLGDIYAAREARLQERRRQEPLGAIWPRSATTRIVTEYPGRSWRRSPKPACREWVCASLPRTRSSGARGEGSRLPESAPQHDAQRPGRRDPYGPGYLQRGSRRHT